MLAFMLVNMNTETPNVAIHVDCKPGQDATIANPLFITVNAACVVTSTDASDDLVGHVVKGDVTLDGKKLTTDPVTVTVKNAQSVPLTAGAFASGIINNQGANLVQLDCNPV